MLDSRLPPARLSPENAGALIAALGHEIRTPMTAILGYSDLALEDAEGDALREHLQVIRRNGELLFSLLNDVLDLAQIELGAMKVHRASTVLRPLLEEVRALMRTPARDKGIDLDLEFRGSLPVTIETDATRLRQILLHLVGNALKFTRRGSVRMVVRMVQATPPARPDVAIDVIDTGVGIPDDGVPLIFRPLASADGLLTRGGSGAGIGLALAQRLATMLGGGISVRSVVGEGSCFTVTLDPGPLDLVPFRNAPALPDPERRRREEGQVPASLSGLHVLITEDIPATQKLVDYHFRRAGARTTLADNGQQALERVAEAERERRPFDLIVLDMQMPILDGYEAARRLRESGCRIPIIALTAHAMEGDREKCLAAGCTDYATKPIDHAALVRRVADLARMSAALPTAPIV